MPTSLPACQGYLLAPLPSFPPQLRPLSAALPPALSLCLRPEIACGVRKQTHPSRTYTPAFKRHRAAAASLACSPCTLLSSFEVAREVVLPTTPHFDYSQFKYGGTIRSRMVHR